MKKRTFLYWGKQTLINIMIYLVTVSVYGMILNSFVTLQEGIASIIPYAIMMATIILVVTPLGFATYQMPLTISMGASRKESFVGLQFVNLLFVVVYGSLILVSINAVRNNFPNYSSISHAIIVGFPFCLGIGELLVIVSLKTKKTATSIISIMVILLFTFGTSMVCLQMVDFNFSNIFRIVEQYFLLLLFISLAFYALGALILKGVIKNYSLTK
ncbi:MAG: hypothetical protein PHY47_04310 [Lachnospiraceae bacterium]|nr:hypothetical protein [Lachnospiraceae bacterium]